MILISLERTPASLRGELSRWLMEIRTGVYIGHVSAVVREALWTKCCEKMGDRGGVILVHTWPNEQGFLVRYAGKPSNEVIDVEGLFLVRRPHRETRVGTSGSPETASTEEEVET